MKTSILVLLAVAALALGDASHKKVADKAFITMQKNLLQLLIRPQALNMNKEQSEVGKAWRMESEMASYTNPQAVKKFWTTYKQGMMPLTKIFSVLNKEYMEEAIQLFEVFYFAKDLDTFYKTACWARDHVNSGMFVYTFTTAVMQRMDCKDFVLPAPYEVYPNMFVTSEVMHKAYDIKMQGDHFTGVPTVFKEDETYYVPSNYTGVQHKSHKEQCVSYFMEDVGVNSFNTLWNMDYPFWANGDAYGIKFDRRGELFYYMQHQIMSRYYLERLSNNLGEVKGFSYSFFMPIAGYEPNMHYTNGRTIPMRPEGVKFFKSYKTEEMLAYERRIFDAIDLGFVITEDGKKIALKGAEGFNALGLMIHGTGDSPNEKFYGDYYNMMLGVFGHITDPTRKYHIAPGVLEHYMTGLRDPAYYVMYKRIDYLFKSYKDHLPAYTLNELIFPGVKIESVDIDKLITYFDTFDMDLDNGITVGAAEDGTKVNIQARQMRLNHKPFTFKVKVVSDKAATVMVRVFLGPKYDSLGNEFTVEKMKDYMIELDRFTEKIVSGTTTIERSSADSSVASVDKKSFRTLLEEVEKGLKGEPFYYDETERSCGWPHRLLLPKGKKQGMPFTFFVMVTPFDDKVVTDAKHLDFTSMPYCGVGRHGVYPDSYPMGFPFDRSINNTDYFRSTPNMLFQDVTIFHKTAQEVGITLPRH